MPRFVEFSREDSRSRREDPMFTLQARGVLSLNNAAFLALGQPQAVALLYDADEDVIALRKVERLTRMPIQYASNRKPSLTLWACRGSRRTTESRHCELGASWLATMAMASGDSRLQEGQPVGNRRGAQESGPAATDLWRHTTNGFDVSALMRIGDVAMSHPSYMTRPAENRPPSMRIGVLVACDPLGATPATSELRSRFLNLLVWPPVMELVSAASHIDQRASWKPYGGHGRINLQAALTSTDDTEAPVASALLLLPEAGMSQFGRDSRYAELVVDIEPRNQDGRPADAMTLETWHDLITRSLALPRVLAEFLTKELGLATLNDPPAQAGIWLKTPHAMTELVNVEDLEPIPGSPVSNWFIGYMIADPAGHRAEHAAVELLGQMCDYTLHLDGHEPLLASFTKKTGKNTELGEETSHA